jgi:hypothetical protein
MLVALVAWKSRLVPVWRDDIAVSADGRSRALESGDVI